MATLPPVGSDGNAIPVPDRAVASLPPVMDVEAQSLELHFQQVMNIVSGSYWKVRINPDSLVMRVNSPSPTDPIQVQTMYIALNLGTQIEHVHSTLPVFPQFRGHISIAYNMDTMGSWDLMWRTKHRLCSLLAERWVTFGLSPRTNSWSLTANCELAVLIVMLQKIVREMHNNVDVDLQLADPHATFNAGNFYDV